MYSKSAPVRDRCTWSFAGASAAPVDIVERSHTFTEALRRRCARDGFGAGEVWKCDLIDAPLPRNAYDLIFARWVFLFLPDVDAHLRKLAAALKPGGRIAIEDYCRGTLRMVPEPPEWNDFLKADLAFFASQGGDANIGARLPALYQKAGLDVIDVTPTTKVGRPGSREWDWMSTYFLRCPDPLRQAPSVHEREGGVAAAPLAGGRPPQDLAADLPDGPRRRRTQTSTA